MCTCDSYPLNPYRSALPLGSSKNLWSLTKNCRTVTAGQVPAVRWPPNNTIHNLSWSEPFLTLSQNPNQNKSYEKHVLRNRFIFLSQYVKDRISERRAKLVWALPSAKGFRGKASMIASKILLVGKWFLPLSEDFRCKCTWFLENADLTYYG